MKLDNFKHFLEQYGKIEPFLKSLMAVEKAQSEHINNIDADEVKKDGQIEPIIIPDD